MTTVTYLTPANYKKNKWPVLVLDLSVGIKKTKNLGWKSKYFQPKPNPESGYTSFPEFIEMIQKLNFSHENLVLLLEAPLSYCLNENNEPVKRGDFEDTSKSWHFPFGMCAASQAKVILDQIIIALNNIDIVIHLAELYQPTTTDEGKLSNHDVATMGLQYYLAISNIVDEKEGTYHSFVTTTDEKETGHLVFRKGLVSFLPFKKW